MKKKHNFLKNTATVTFLRDLFWPIFGRFRLVHGLFLTLCYTFIKIEQSTAVDIITRNRRSRSIKYLQKLKHKKTKNRLARLTAPRVGEVVFYRISDDVDGNTIVEESGPVSEIEYTSYPEFNYNFRDKKTAEPFYATNIEANLETNYYKYYVKNSENSENNRMPFEKELNAVKVFDTCWFS